MSSFRPGFVRANSVTKRLHRYSQICQRMEPRGHYVEPHVQDLSYLSYLLAEHRYPSNSLPSGRKSVQKLDARRRQSLPRKRRKAPPPLHWGYKVYSLQGESACIDSYVWHNPGWH
jgi:hypothetical protein